ncbi:hypothetical protein Tco_0869372 [Tanacetum coccineum]
MASPGPGNIIIRLAIDEFVEFSGETELSSMQWFLEMEAIDDRIEVYDSLMCLRESKRVENNKMLGLDDMIDEDISVKEGHVEIMKAAV